MPPEQRALINPDGVVLGQVILFETFAVAPLHVIGPRQTKITTRNQFGNVTAIDLVRVAVIDPSWDIIIYRIGLHVKSKLRAACPLAEMGQRRRRGSCSHGRRS